MWRIEAHQSALITSTHRLPIIESSRASPTAQARGPTDEPRGRVRCRRLEPTEHLAPCCNRRPPIGLGLVRVTSALLQLSKLSKRNFSHNSPSIFVFCRIRKRVSITSVLHHLPANCVRLEWCYVCECEASRMLARLDAGRGITMLLKDALRYLLMWPPAVELASAAAS